ncbi:MAG: hypothetical protein NTZ98_08570, partial [Acidobacteria bacterium]|nr:hypothetical protein [Acidobacteriota bacterium]
MLVEITVKLPDDFTQRAARQHAQAESVIQLLERQSHPPPQEQSYTRTRNSYSSGITDGTQP